MESATEVLHAAGLSPELSTLRATPRIDNASEPPATIPGDFQQSPFTPDRTLHTAIETAMEVGPLSTVDGERPTLDGNGATQAAGRGPQMAWVAPRVMITSRGWNGQHFAGPARNAGGRAPSAAGTAR
jgi:hypothetical protein